MQRRKTKPKVTTMNDTATVEKEIEINETEPILESNAPAQAGNVAMENGVPTIISQGPAKDAPAVAAAKTAAAAAVSTSAPAPFAGVNVMSGAEHLHTISILVENQPGVLSRVSHVFARRGFNLESLAVSRTEDPTVSRMTVVVAGDDAAFTQIGKQLLKLIDVIKVIDHTRDDLVNRELALIKVRATSSKRGEIMQIANAFRAKMVDIGEDSIMIEVTGKEAKVDAIQKMLEPFEILELVRTGKIVLVRGPKQT